MKGKENMKNLICTVTGIVGSLVVSFFGGWTASLTTLLIFMVIDYATGLIVARAASDGNTTIGETVKKEFTKSSYIYIVGGALMGILGFLPGCFILI